MSKFKCETSIEASSPLWQQQQTTGDETSTSFPILIGSIDQGTSSTRFLLFNQQGRIVASAQMEHTQIFPSDHVGWHEHDPLELWESTLTCMRNVIEAMEQSEYRLDLRKNPLRAIGITNQRETTIAWNAETGRPYYNAIVWDDLRTTDIASSIANGNQDRLREKTGLPLASYFAGTKVRWLIDNVPELRDDLLDETKRSQVRFGTVDTWLVYQLTGTRKKNLNDRNCNDGAANVGGEFVTDVTNASRWLFMDLETLEWDQELIRQVCEGSGILPPLTSLPKIESSSSVFHVCAQGFGIEALEGTPIAGILGDQQAALFGQGAFEPGEAKNTYGTGLFLMMNTGKTRTPSTHGLLTTVGYRLGQDDAVYALEGSVSHSGSTIQWLRDQLQIIQCASESEVFARKVKCNDGLYFVPAFAGLFAPYWRSDARACIVGMTASHNKNHFCRAALESTAYQTKDVFDAIDKDSHVSLKELRVDGGGTANELLMQFQADIINVPVVKPVVKETTALGAAFAAGLAVGVWKNTDEIKALWAEEKRFLPSMEEETRRKNLEGWKKAIIKSMGWTDDNVTSSKL
jgi:glycerol kinase